MDGLKASFERELKTKLQQKSSGNQSEEQVLMKSFKYFDLNDNGTVEPDEFAKAIEKIGIMIPTKQDLDALFGLYDTDGSGSLSYKEFSQILFARPSTAQSQGGKGAARSPEEIAEALRAKLISRGAKGFIGLQRQFKIMDDNNNRSLDKYEFNKAMKDFGLGFSDSEIQTLFSYFDFDRSNAIEFDEFIRAIRGPMNPARKRVVALCFKKLDKDGNNWVDINDVRGTYNAKKHPDVVAGKKTEDQILQEFLQTFEIAHSIRNSDAPNYVVTKEEFEEYYNNISASIDNDAEFELILTNAWRLTEESRRGMGTKGWASEGADKPPHQRGAQPSNIFNRDDFGAQKKTAAAEAGVPANATEAQLLTQVQEKLAQRGPRGIASIGRKFKIADDNNSKTLDKEEFKKAMGDFRCGLNQKQIGQLFDVFDRDASGEISYDEFLRSIRGEMNAARVAVVKKCFKIMDKDNSGLLDINDIRQNYNAKQHPLVKQGKKTEEEVLLEFLDTFEDHFCDMKGHADARDGKVNLTEWVEYYNNVSMSIDDDAYFQLMLNNAWNLDNSKVTKKGWGGEI